MVVPDMADSFSVPDSWKLPLMSLGAMLALAGLDFIGSIFAKEWAERGHITLLVAGLASFTVLFIVYARILKVAELSVVTLGWIVFLQVGILALDRFHYGVTLPWHKWAAILAILVLQAYLLVGPSSTTNKNADSAQATVAPGDVVIAKPSPRQ